MAQWKSLGIDLSKSKETFSNFEVWNMDSRVAKDTAVAFYNDFNYIKSTKQNSILFCGQVGSGKTHLSIALALNFIQHNIRIVYMPYRDIIVKLKQNMLDEEYYERIISKYKLAEVLLIDDLFKGKTSQADFNIMFEIINYRYLNHLPMVISTENTIEELLFLDEAIGSRVYEMCKNYTVQIERGSEKNYRLK